MCKYFEKLRFTVFNYDDYKFLDDSFIDFALILFSLAESTYNIYLGLRASTI
jgi:hypothetical protein